MFINHNPVDKAATKFNYGYGPFSFKGNKLSQYVQMSTNAPELNHKWTFAITLAGNDRFKQVMTNPKTNTQQIEIYTRVK